MIISYGGMFIVYSTYLLQSIPYCFMPVKVDARTIFPSNKGEGVGTSKITSSKGQNIESLINLIRMSKVKRSERRKSN